jgi:hypothetical protein
MILTVGLTVCQGPVFMPTCILYRVILVMPACNDINKHIRPYPEISSAVFAKEMDADNLPAPQAE